jgi:hypothetical protein
MAEDAIGRNQRREPLLDLRERCGIDEQEARAQFRQLAPFIRQR